ncbi:MAG TPA: T9SS type A sorting domain-containing protein [Bacteroidia bacterium]|nr:T9SS type A sorting domain-containing protein [Bacteroidia bacterium]
MKKISGATLFLILLNIQPSASQSFTLLLSGCNNRVNAIAADASSPNNVYAAGTFDHAGGNTATRMAKWNGSSWSGMDNGMDATVRALTFFNNELYAGGDFIYAGSASTVVWMVTKWNGSAWVALDDGVRGVGVYSLAVYQNELYAGGFFDTVYNAGNGIVKWNGSAWVALGPGQNKGVFGAPGYRVRAMKAFGGNLYVGGTFATAGGVAVNNIAKWNGSSWSAIGTGTNGDVNAFAVFNGDLYAGGDFTVANGVTVNHVARISGNTFAALGAGTNGIVNGLATFQNNLFVTGNFSTSGGTGTQNISRWDGSWHLLSGIGITGIDGPGYSLFPYNGNLYIGGLFGVAGNLIQANSIVQWNMPPTGVDETNFNSNSITVYPNPSSGKFQLQLTGSIPEKFDLYVTDISGRNLYYQKVDNYRVNSQVDIAPFKSGMYFLKLVNEHNVSSTKLIIE